MRLLAKPEFGSIFRGSEANKHSSFLRRKRRDGWNIPGMHNHPRRKVEGQFQSANATGEKGYRGTFAGWHDLLWPHSNSSRACRTFGVEDALSIASLFALFSVPSPVPVISVAQFLSQADVSAVQTPQHLRLNRAGFAGGRLV